MVSILLLTDGLAPFVVGGMQEHSTQLALQLLTRGAELKVVYCGPDYGVPVSPELAAEQTKIAPERLIPVGLTTRSRGPGHYIRDSYRYSHAIWSTVNDSLGQFDIVYAQGFTAVAFGRRRNMPPVVSNLHGLGMFQRPSGWRDALRRLALRLPANAAIRKADALQSLGGYLGSTLERVGGGKHVFTCPNGVGDDWLCAEPLLERGRPVRRFIFVGRPEYDKGLHLLERAVETLSREAALQLDVVGSNPREGQRYGAAIYHGELRDRAQLKTLFDQADVLVLPSLAEGLPTVVLEAFARGVPVIATDVGAVRDVVGPETGWLIPPGDVGALTAAMRDAMTLPADEYHRRRVAARRKGALLAWSVVGAMHLEQLTRIAKERTCCTL